MTREQKIKILIAWDYCDSREKSTEFMLQFMSDCSGVDIDEIAEYITTDGAENDRDIFYENDRKL